MVNQNTVEAIDTILEAIDTIISQDKDMVEGVPTILGDISKDFLTKLALARMEDGFNS